MHKIKLFALLGALNLLIGCKPETNSAPTVPIDLDNPGQKVSIRKVFSKVEIIPLQTSEQSLIKQADKTIYYNQKYYVSDMDQHAVFIFDTAGKFLKKVQKATRGIGDFERFRDIEINKFDNTLELLSPNGTVFVYSLDGVYLSTYFIPGVKAVHFFKHINKDEVAFYGMFEERRIIIYSKSSNTATSTYPVPDFLSRNTPLSSPWSPFYSYKDSVYFSPTFSNLVYNVTPKGLEVKFVWDFGKYGFNYDTLTLNKPREYYRGVFGKNQKLVWSKINNYETNDKIFTTFILKGELTSLIYKKSTKTYNVFKAFSEGVIYPRHLEFYDTFSIAAVDPDDISRCIKPEFLDKANAETLKNLKSADNPLIIKYYY